MAKISSQLPKLWLKANRVKYGKHLRLGGWPFVFRFPQAEITIGRDCSINSSFFSNLLGLYSRTILVAKRTGKIQIGDRVGISGSTIYAWEQIRIGNDTIIGANCKIFDNDFHSIDPEERRQGLTEHVPVRPVIIGNNVFVGCNCIILKGTVLGDNCVVGAGSVVHGTFEAGSVLAGNPARIIRRVGE